MNTEEAKKIQTFTYLLIWVTLIIFAYGFAYHRQIVMLAGLLGVGLTLLIHAPLSFFTLSQRQREDAKTKFACWGEGFFALGQLIFGIFAVAGVIADAATNYLSSGMLWKQVSQYSLTLFFCFGMFCSLVGISQIAANLIPDGDRMVDKLGSFKEIIEGAIFFIIGLFFIGFLIFAKISS